MVQRPLGQQILDDTLERAPEAVKARFAVLIDKGPTANPMVNGFRRGTTPGQASLYVKAAARTHA